MLSGVKAKEARGFQYQYTTTIQYQWIFIYRERDKHWQKY